MATVKGRWIFNKTLSVFNTTSDININFISNGMQCEIMLISPAEETVELGYYPNIGTIYSIGGWVNEAYRIVDFGDIEQEFSEYHYEWFLANAMQMDTTAYKLIQIAENEQKVYDAGYAEGVNEGESLGYDKGYSAGRTEGESLGYDSGYSAGIEAGIKTEYDRFWDAYQNNGKRIEYYYCFSGMAWNDGTFKPKYDITMQYSGNSAFIYNNVTDIAESLKNCGVVLDTKGATNVSNMFYNARTKALPTLDFSAVVTPNLASNTFHSCSKLERIEKLILGNKFIATTTMFLGCSKLKDIVFEGEIINNFGMGECIALSKESIESVVGCLSNTASGKTLTLSQTAVNNAFTSEEWAALIADKTNWTFSLV